MARVMLVQPWNYHDEGVTRFNLEWEWRNGPYSLLLLATQLQVHGHEVRIVDMIRDLVLARGSVVKILNDFARNIETFRPDIIGFSFFSIHYFEVRQAVTHARQVCARHGCNPVFVAGGIHASTEPYSTIKELGFDYAFVGEGDLGILDLADGSDPSTVQGIVKQDSKTVTKGKQITDLSKLPFPDWKLCDYKFYAYPSYGKLKYFKSSSIDMIMGRGCVYKCSFCAYNALSQVRFYPAGYLVEQINKYHRDLGIDGIYFTDSTIGNNRRLVREFCEEMIRSKTADRVTWYANIRPNQISEKDLKLMWQAGCRFLFYGFESGSQRVLDLMVKGIELEANYRAAELHNRLGYLYHASMLFGYPGEREEDILQTFDFLDRTKPPIIGINWYVPLPGSPDYDDLKARGVINTDDPEEWRRIGEVNACKVYADVPEARFRELYAQAEKLVADIPAKNRAAWGCLAPPHSETYPGLTGRAGFLGHVTRRLKSIVN
jgi:radical SAM superfamily enzyme YgiQ (UPF0313 family)